MRLTAREKALLQNAKAGAPAAKDGQRLSRSAAVLSLAVLADSAIEHYRGGFYNRVMYTPLAVSCITLATSLHGLGDRRQSRHPVRHAVQATAAATGLVGMGIHIYNVGKRPGGFIWQNLFFGAPVGAPFALVLAGTMGTAAEHVRDGRRRLFGFPTGRLLAAITAFGLLGTAGEAALLHFRGAYHDPAMFLPITLPPVAAGLMAEAAINGDRRRRHRLARWWLRLTAVLGFAGVGFHAFGVARNMGGWRNWTQNVQNGPPLPAPPSFTGLALAGLAALDRLEREQA
ncbi:MAG: hypothetical protein ACREF1_16665 [Acetobacteraceae bacterium]